MSRFNNFLIFVLFLVFLTFKTSHSVFAGCTMPDGSNCPISDLCGGSYLCAPNQWCNQSVESGCVAACLAGTGSCICSITYSCVGGSGGSCPWSRVDCPPNSQKGKVVSSFCGGISYCGVGTAQKSGACCRTVTIPKSGCNWVNCPQVKGGPKCKEVCDTPEESYCASTIITQYQCVADCSAGSAPTLLLPDNGDIFAAPSGTHSADFSWSAVTDWGTEGTSGNRGYDVCVGTDPTDPCAIGGATYSTTGLPPASSVTGDVTFGTKYWGVKATNACGSDSVISSIRSMCVEGFVEPDDAGDGNAYLSKYGTCNATTGLRTRTCREDCGTDNCAAVAAAGSLTEQCQGIVTGTIFDATELSTCPAFDPTTGYLIGVDTTLTANNKAITITDQNTTSPHPWAPLASITTDSSGNYFGTVIAPATYTYNFNSLSDMYIVSTGPKLTCTSSSAVVPSNSTSCGTQPCTAVTNMSFGFNRKYGGWWQAVGAGVHGEGGVRSGIPASLPTEQSLILGDGTSSNRRGVLTYGATTSNMLGTNTNAQVSANLWKVQSNYEGLIYDYDYFNQQFKKYATTTWNGTSSISYDDNGSGYEIFKVSGSVANFSYNPTGTQKVIFLVNGNVTVSSNLVIPSGAYMAIIASGDITFNTNVTRADGWFTADNIKVPCIDANSDLACDETDSQFLGNGSFVAWKGFSLGRDRGAVNNGAGPAEKFTYRIDLYTNAPVPMKNITKRYKPFVP